MNLGGGPNSFVVPQRNSKSLDLKIWVFGFRHWAWQLTFCPWTYELILFTNIPVQEVGSYVLIRPLIKSKWQWDYGSQSGNIDLKWFTLNMTTPAVTVIKIIMHITNAMSSWNRKMIKTFMKYVDGFLLRDRFCATWCSLKMVPNLPIFLGNEQTIFWLINFKNILNEVESEGKCNFCQENVRMILTGE